MRKKRPYLSESERLTTLWPSMVTDLGDQFHSFSKSPLYPITNYTLPRQYSEAIEVVAPHSFAIWKSESATDVLVTKDNKPIGSMIIARMISDEQLIINMDPTSDKNNVRLQNVISLVGKVVTAFGTNSLKSFDFDNDLRERNIPVKSIQCDTGEGHTFDIAYFPRRDYMTIVRHSPPPTLFQYDLGLSDKN